jgi:NAD(P)-dependent dehydrogenase (short-subunit alcohol dehydrogenase family)
MNAYFSSGAKQTVIVTGGNQGLGYACAETLAYADQNWCVIIAGHERDRIAAAAEMLREKSKAHVEPMLLNLASLRSIRYFSENLSEKLRDGHIPPLRALVCNAGVQMTSGISYTADGFEQTFGVNHLGHFLLVNLLLSQFTSPGRVVIVSGGAPNPLDVGGILNPAAKPDARKLAWPESPGGLRMNGVRRYRTSKLCNQLFAYELHRRLAGASPLARLSDIDVNVFNPAMTPGTGLNRTLPFLLQRVWESKTIHSVARCFGAKISTVEKSGRAMAALITNPDLQGISGKCFQVANDQKPLDLSCDKVLAKKLWNDSAELVSWNKPAVVFIDSSTLAYSEPVHLL